LIYKIPFEDHTKAKNFQVIAECKLRNVSKRRFFLNLFINFSLNKQIFFKQQEFFSHFKFSNQNE